MQIPATGCIGAKYRWPAMHMHDNLFRSQQLPLQASHVKPSSVYQCAKKLSTMRVFDTGSEHSDTLAICKSFSCQNRRFTAAMPLDPPTQACSLRRSVSNSRSVACLDQTSALRNKRPVQMKHPYSFLDYPTLIFLVMNTGGSLRHYGGLQLIVKRLLRYL